MANFRPLQPAPMDQEQPSQPQSRPLLTHKPKRTVTLGACIACRKRKSKCDGSRPVCTCCAQKDSECIYELGPNEKPSQAMKRKNEEMQGELSNLRQLYDFLRLRPEQEALEILRRIRNNPLDTTPTQRIQELADFVRHGDLLIQPSLRLPTQYRSNAGTSVTLPPLRLALDSPSLETSAYSHTLPFPGILSMGSDGPAAQRRRHASDADVSARNWTTVTHDHNLLIILMSAWHEWEYKYHHFLDWDIFLDDLSSGRTMFCSKLLVNAILASGICASFDCCETLALIVLGKHGRDKVGHTFLVEACRIARHLDLFRVLPSTSIQRPQGITEAKWERSRAVTAWALSMSFTYSFSPIVKSQPPLQVPYDDETEGKNPVASPTSTLTVCHKALFRSECGRSVIVLDCANTLVDQDDVHSEIPPKPEQIEVLYFRLRSWWDSRSERLDPTKFPSPENLLAAMQYNVSITRLFQPFLDQGSSLERVKIYHNRARSIFSTSMKELRRLLVLHEVHHGWSSTIPYVLHPIMVTGFGSLDEIALEDRSRLPPEQSEPYQGLLTCFHALSTLSSFVFYAQPLYRLLTQACETLDIRLPPEVTSTLGYYRSEEWTKNAANVVSSQYVADTRVSENVRMDVVVSQWDALTIGDSSSTNTSEMDHGAHEAA
ncbi:hypothetical protein K505DRAFT_254615 [Melanomma pulvis-pyrius CBS 109.77]|uniref:Zn(2)-C6 fungal-type domain-containing protein n=1 Tax=Melanomma pulvis-pyrius CBS 109.77 TaxID=1314802 RepID=A0A6A6WXK7_9PLEO|nr:hypothetical protein K505DRAFT_254615 [Melanomma pulvis-pyrius CBS 109.77]